MFINFIPLYICGNWDQLTFNMMWLVFSFFDLFESRLRELKRILPLNSNSIIIHNHAMSSFAWNSNAADTQWRHKSKISQKLGDEANKIRFGRTKKFGSGSEFSAVQRWLVISYLGVRGPWSVGIKLVLFLITNGPDWALNWDTSHLKPNFVLVRWIKLSY